MVSLENLEILQFCTTDTKVLFYVNKTHTPILNFVTKVKIYMFFWLRSVTFGGSLEAVFCTVLCTLCLWSTHYLQCSWITFISGFN